ncbi:MAG: sugar phosphate nucleotidyltransferase [Chloroflexota bacterium]
MKAVILVGGEGTRLRPLTNKVPKPMLPVLNRPFLEHTLAYLRPHVDEAVLAVGYMPGAIQDYFGVRECQGLRLSYSIEETPLGTAGAVKKSEQLLGDTFMVLNGDIFTDLELDKMVAFHRRNRAAATIALLRVDDPSAFGVLETDPEGRVHRFVEKPSPGETASHWINAGIYLLEPHVLEHVPPDTHYMFEKGLFPLLLESGQPVYGYRFARYWLDMGTPSKYLELNCDLLEGRTVSPLLGPFPAEREEAGGVQVARPSAEVRGPVVAGQGCTIEPGCHVVGPVVLGAGCHIEQGATLESSVLWDNVTVESDARVERSVVATGCTVKRGNHVAETVVIES